MRPEGAQQMRAAWLLICAVLAVPLFWHLAEWPLDFAGNLPTPSLQSNQPCLRPSPTTLGSRVGLRIGWYHLSASNSAGVFSVAQDHRTYPAQLPVQLRDVSFSELRPDPRLRVFQFHMGVDISCAKQADQRRAFDTVELAYDDHGDRSQTVPTRVKLAAQRCVGLQITGLAARLQSTHFQFVDAVARCAFLIDDELALRLSDQERVQASFDVHACNDTVHFPLAQVLHFPQASPIIQGGLLPHPSNGFPSALWAGAEVKVVRARGSDAKLRVGAVVFKKFAWLQPDDDLWLLWMLDVVGVDHVVINVATRDLPMEVVRESLARHEGLAERVTLVDLDFPNHESQHSYDYLLQAQAHELFLRWQADFDFIFLLDQDEFPQLFDTDTANTTNQPRIDIKTFIGRNEKSFVELGQVYFPRLFVQRSVSNKEPDPLLPTFLRELATLDGLVTSAVWADRSNPAEALGKALFLVGAALHPYLHYNDHWPGLTLFDWRAGHVLHVREPLPQHTVAEAQLQLFVDEFAQRKANSSAG